MGNVPLRHIQFMTYNNQTLKNYTNIIERKFSTVFWDHLPSFKVRPSISESISTKSEEISLILLTVRKMSKKLCPTKPLTASSHTLFMKKIFIHPMEHKYGIRLESEQKLNIFLLLKKSQKTLKMSQKLCPRKMEKCRFSILCKVYLLSYNDYRWKRVIYVLIR